MSRRLWKLCLAASLLAIAAGVTLAVMGMRYAASGEFNPIEGTGEPATMSPVVPGLLLATFGVCCLLMVAWKPPAP
jgi:hypothetical protein